MVKKDRKQLVLALIVVLVLFVLSFTFIFIYKLNENKNNRNYVLDVYFKNTNEIYIENTLPVSDELGKKFDGSNTEKGIQGYKEFSIKNNYSKYLNYELYLMENSKCEKKIDSNYIVFYLTDENNKPLTGFENNKLPTFASLSVLNDKASGRVLYSGFIKSSSKQKFKLRVWVSDLYTLKKYKECFSVDVYVRSV